MNNLNWIKILGVIAIIIAAIFFFRDWQKQNDEIKRLESNYKNQLKAQSKQELEYRNQMLEFHFKKNRELKEFMDSNNQEFGDLKSRLEKQNIKLNRITRIVGNQINARDTIINRINLDSLAHKFATLREFTVPFVDSTKCFYTKMELVYKDGVSTMQVLDRQYNDTIWNITTKDRNKWSVLGLFDTKIFGKRIYKVNLISNCGNSRTIIINKDD